MTAPQLLSEEMKATASALRAVRTKLIQMLAADELPPWSVPDASTVQVLGLDVALALEALADVPPPPRTPSYLDERR